MKSLIYGKDETENIVGMHVKDDKLYIYEAHGDKTKVKTKPYQDFILMDRYDEYIEPTELKGPGEFKFMKTAPTRSMREIESDCYYKRIKMWKSYNKAESAMLRDGYTLYNGMKLNDISVLSFDIETTGVTIDENSYVVLISNTYRSRTGSITKRLFSFNDYDSPKSFIDDWCKWVREIDPDILTGHNIFGFDLPYLRQFAKKYKTKLVLGRDISPAKFSTKPRQFRKDGSQTYDYYNVEVAGRNLIDTFFLSIKSDFQRRYPSYGLKPIMEFEGWEKEGRQHWDFSKNKEPWNKPEDWKLFKQYAMDDADDALVLFDNMMPQFFYYTQSVPMQMQNIINRASGSQVNMFMIRSYLQDGWAIPEPSEKEYFKGGISMGNPGIYHNVYKVDVASLYPSIMLQYRVENKEKDPRGLFLKMVEYFTAERLANKKKAADTGDRYYKDLSDGQKIFINSAYGFQGAPGLHFNFPEGAAEVTRKGREILQGAIDWAAKENCPLVNADTDSISFVPRQGISMEACLVAINSLTPAGIVWEDDGIYKTVIVIKAKNYVMDDGKKVVIKGSALKATMKEPALKRFLKETVDLMLQDSVDKVGFLYQDYVEKICQIESIADWCSKKTITKNVLYPKRTTEQRILDAVAGENVQEGDKIHVFFEQKDKLTLRNNFSGTYHRPTLHGKLFNTVKILENVLDMKNFPNYKLKGTQKDLLKMGLIQEVV